MKINKNLEILKAISATTPFTIKQVSIVFDITKSYNDTLLLLHASILFNKYPTELYNEIKSNNLSVKEYLLTY